MKNLLQHIVYHILKIQFQNKINFEQFYDILISKNYMIDAILDLYYIFGQNNPNITLC